MSKSDTIEVVGIILIIFGIIFFLLSCGPVLNPILKAIVDMVFLYGGAHLFPLSFIMMGLGGILVKYF